MADVALTGLSTDVWHRFNDDAPGQSVSICPLPGTVLFRVQAAVPMHGDVDLTPEGLTALIAAHAQRSDVSVQSVS